MPDLEGLRNFGALVAELAMGRPSGLKSNPYDGIRREQWGREQQAVEAAGGRACLIEEVDGLRQGGDRHAAIWETVLGEESTYALFLLFGSTGHSNPTKGVVVEVRNNGAPAVSFTAEGGTWKLLEVVFPYDKNVQTQQALREMSLGERVREARQRALQIGRGILTGDDLLFGRRVRRGFTELSVSRIYPRD